jgi:hypothetical protein
MPEESTNTENSLTTRTGAQENQEVDASRVRHWKPGLPRPMRGYSLSAGTEAHTRNVANAGTQHSEPQTKSSRVAQTICRGFAGDEPRDFGETIDSYGESTLRAAFGIGC